MREFKNLNDLKELPHARELIKLHINYLDIDVAKELTRGASFESIFGGNMFLVESKEQFKEICPNVESDEGYLTPFDTFDEVYITPDKRVYVIFTIINNDAGGPTYILPDEIIDEDIRFTIELTLAQN